jgi:predicted negative regulator of RcsB-dependent stress response
MATYDLEEQEKIDGLKSWWEVYGTLAIIIVATFIAGIFGTQAWKYYQKQQTDYTAELFISLQEIEVGGDPKKIGDAAHLLMESFPSSGFASRAALISARASLDANDVQNARNQLQWLLVHSEEDELRDLARLRLAGLLLDEKKHDEALKLLESKHSEFFAGIYGDLKGDVLAAKGSIPEARAAYKMAMDRIDGNGTHYKIVQMKLDALIETK